LYYHAPKLFRDLQMAQADGSLARRLKQWSRITLLIIDDLGMAATGTKPYRELLEIIDDRPAGTRPHSRRPAEGTDCVERRQEG